MFGPLKTTIGDKKYILSMTDAFTKYVELVVTPSKEAAVIAKAIFDRWICRYGCPLEIVTDQGKEFWAKLSNELKIRHATTSPYHRQCNSQAEVAYKTIAKYLASVVDETTGLGRLHWPLDVCLQHLVSPVYQNYAALPHAWNGSSAARF